MHCDMEAVLFRSAAAQSSCLLSSHSGLMGLALGMAPRGSVPLLFSHHYSKVMQVLRTNTSSALH